MLRSVTEERKVMLCCKCKIELNQYISRKLGVCMMCRPDLIPAHIPEMQWQRYLKRRYNYEPKIYHGERIYNNEPKT